MPSFQIERAILARILFRAIGVILLIVAAIHFAVTSPLAHQLFDGQVDSDITRLIRASFLLNHLVVGVLLAPLGISTFLAAPGIARGDRLGRRIGWANTLAIIAMPAVIAAVMGRAEIFSGGPFTIATALVTLAALAMILGMLVTAGAEGLSGRETSDV